MNSSALLSEVLNVYSGFSTYVDSGLLSRELLDQGEKIGTGKIFFKTLYKAPNRFYCHFDSSMPQPFDYIVDKVSLGYDGETGFLYEREHGYPASFKTDNFRTILSITTGISGGLTSKIAALLMPNTGGTEITSIQNIKLGEAISENGQECFFIDGTYPGGGKIELLIEKVSKLIVAAKEFNISSTITIQRQEIRVNEDIPDDLFSIPRY